MIKKEGYEVEKKVLVELIRKSLAQVKGVHSIQRGLWGKSIEIKELKEGIEISLGLIIREGSAVPQTVRDVQKKVKDEIEKTLETSVKKVDVKIKGIKS
ncbi:MAG: Asp23/Gls24 family envelope stress response protein [Candidatus Aerophobetes bacterium]|nr:Asp23/Gls24 family envelope stress response protein [Candidatus Aerophobetes bacterium]